MDERTYGACLDVHYAPEGARVAALGFGAWEDAAPRWSRALSSPVAPAPYQPGAFASRELPHLLHLLAALSAAERPSVVVVDAHVWLDGGRPGLGAHLHAALAGQVAVVGVAKRPFRGDAPALAVRRGASAVPLYVSAAGLPPEEAAAAVARMHGPHRLPTLLSRVDRLARGTWPDG